VNVEHSGSFVTSNDRLNEVSRIGRGSFLGNLAFGFPSDCPTREKRGWLDSGHGAAPWAMMNYDVAATYTVFLRTIRDAQLFHGGATGNMPSYAPAFGNGLTQLAGILQEDTPDDLADPGWAAAYGLLVEYMYTFYADDRVWSDHYEHVARYIEFVAANATDSDGLFTYSRFGDW
jgi:alpha-L-rhamnosidase